MSFLKITDPKKRDFIVNEFLKKRQHIQQNFLSEGLGDLSAQYELSSSSNQSRTCKQNKRRPCKRIKTN